MCVWSDCVVWGEERDAVCGVCGVVRVCASVDVAVFVGCICAARLDERCEEGLQEG